MTIHIDRRSFLAGLAAAPLLGLQPRAARAQATPIAGDITASLQQAVDGYVESGAFMGAVLVRSGGETLLRGGFGFAEIFRKDPNTPETAFQIASLTKAFTALCLVQLAEAGALGLDDEVAPWLPEATHLAQNGVAITIRMLLNHTAGVPDFLEFYDLSNPLSYPRTFDQLLGDIVEHELEFTPGTDYHYSNSGYIYAGLIVERASGVTYEEYLRANILEPAGMANTYLVDPPDPAPPVAVGYGQYNGQLVGVSAWGRVDLVWAAGGLTSTIDDLARWHDALGTDLLASPAAIAQMYDWGEHDYGLGWEPEELAGHIATGHEGHTIGYDAKLSRFLDDDALIVILSNMQDAPVTDIGRDLAAIVFA